MAVSKTSTYTEFKDEGAKKNQSQSFSGVGAQHQNAKAERAIQTAMQIARTFLLDDSLYWSYSGDDDITSGAFVFKHAAWL
ncbi:hypothetical protein ACHAWF_013779 [Thalassiosira exigua]